ncbi:MAG: LacI family DNA-binding transcriptional regulator [Gemmataceae bacterium]
MSHTSNGPKYLRLSQELEARILQGDWANRKMPSLRVIAEEHDVSVVTAARAIQVLSDKVIINKAEKSGYIPTPENKKKNQKWGLCLRVTPGNWQKVSGAVSRAGLEAVAGQDNIEFVETFDLGEGVSRKDMQQQVRRALDEGISGIFFLPSRLTEAQMYQDEKFLGVCAAENVAVVLVDRNLRGHCRKLEYDLVCVDDFEGGLRCTEHLLEIGRKRVGIVVASPTSSHDGRIAGYTHQLRINALRQGQQEGGYEPIVLTIPTDLSSKEADRWLANRLVEANVDGVVCYQDSVAIGLIMELFSRGLNVPRDIAVVGFDNLPIGDLFTIGVSTYLYPSEAVIRHALHVMHQRLEWPAGPPVKVSVQGELIIRESSLHPGEKETISVRQEA